jgi:uncharacterized repeat protein (TIGR03847 family)
MERARHDFGEATSIDAEAIGQPGQRRFRLLVRSGTQSAVLWMEKQQLQGIGDWLADVIKKEDEANPATPVDVEPEPFGAVFDIDLQVVQIGLGFDEDRKLFAVQAFDVQSTAAEPALQCHVSLGQSRVLVRTIERVIAGGRPICPLCGAPIEPEGHMCPKSNGHAH